MKKATVLFALLFLAMSLGLVADGRACSSFVLSENDRPLLGKNYDWNFGDGLVMVNKRNTTKTAVVDDHDSALTWTSRYGNVTFNQYGRDFASGGMNEAGLIMEVLWLDETQYPEPDQRFGLDSLQWVQHHLDVSVTVADVLASDAALRIDPDSAPVHFLVCDRSGACTVIEFLEGRMIAYQNADLPVMALTNTPYRESVAFLKQCEGFGGAQPIGRSVDSLDRFARAAAGIAADASADQVAAPFNLLDDVAMADCSREECTRWSIVYDLGQETIHFRTVDNPDQRSIALADFDFACETPVRILDVNAPGQDNVSGMFKDYDSQDNRALIAAAYAQTDFLRDLPSETVDYVAFFPERFSRCETVHP